MFSIIFKEFMILPADKGRAVVVLNKSEYNSKALELLNDSYTYRKEKKDPTSKVTTQVKMCSKPSRTARDSLISSTGTCFQLVKWYPNFMVYNRSLKTHAHWDP